MDLNFLSFAAGVISSIFIPFIVYLKNRIDDKCARKKFRLMIYNEYVEPILKLDFDNETYSTMREKALNEVHLNIKKLEYLKEKELTYLSSNNQFYFLRVVVCTNMLLKKIDVLFNSYEFEDPSLTVRIEDDKKTNYKNKINSYIDYYKSNIDKYADLKIDKFQTPD